MIFEDVTAYRSAELVAKVCIIGTGPSGMAIALQLAHAGIPVVMLEAGSTDFSDESQDFYKGKVEGDFYFDLDITSGLIPTFGTPDFWQR